MNNVQISVIIPVFNGEKTINKTLASIIYQKVKPLEVIIINDGSTDNTENICRRYEQEYSYIKLISLKHNKGVSNARNRGISLANGKYIHFVDSDDTLTEDMYLKVNEYLKQNNVDVLSTGANIVCKNEFNILESRNINTNRLCTNKKEIAQYLKEFSNDDKERVLNVIWNKIYSIEIIKENNIRFDENIDLGEDFLFNCDYFKEITSLLEVKECLYNYYKNQSNNLTTKFRTDILKRRKIIYEAWSNLYKNYNIYDEEKINSFSIYEGKMMYFSLYTVFLQDCKLTDNEKEKFIKSLINDDHVKYINYYLRFSIDKVLINCKNEKLLYKYMKLKNKLKSFIKKGLKK